jgi:cell division protease FtsH
MVCEWGMSDELGALTYGKKDDQVFLGKDISQSRDFSDETARQIDLAVRKIIDNAMATVAKLLKEHEDILERMSLDLLEKETIVLKDMEEIIEELRPGQYTDRMTKKDAAKPQPQPVKETVETVTPVVEDEKVAATEPADTVAEIKEEQPQEEKKNDPEAP